MYNSHYHAFLKRGKKWDFFFSKCKWKNPSKNLFQKKFEDFNLNIIFSFWNIPTTNKNCYPKKFINICPLFLKNVFLLFISWKVSWKNNVFEKNKMRKICFLRNFLNWTNSSQKRRRNWRHTLYLQFSKRAIEKLNECKKINQVLSKTLPFNSAPFKKSI